MAIKPLFEGDSCRCISVPNSKHMPLLRFAVEFAALYLSGPLIILGSGPIDLIMEI
ncbi:hypothetical protein A0123_00100 [Gluconobacter cerinus]|uniref:Uncharacterized protein n=1 Tax=Gluconobacter cerinus TaxID=38307 RepID=A0A1B6VPZ3_9PROT|nr:hypothetical protein A0123_00100 [Gluconobacter cerinus]